MARYVLIGLAALIVILGARALYVTFHKDSIDLHQVTIDSTAIALITSVADPPLRVPSDEKTCVTFRQVADGTPGTVTPFKGESPSRAVARRVFDAICTLGTRTATPIP